MPSQTPGYHRRSHDSSTYIKIRTPWLFQAATLKLTSRFWFLTGAIARITWVLLTSASTSSRGQLMWTTQHTDRDPLAFAHSGRPAKSWWVWNGCYGFASKGSRGNSNILDIDAMLEGAFSRAPSPASPDARHAAKFTPAPAKKAELMI